MNSRISGMSRQSTLSDKLINRESTIGMSPTLNPTGIDDRIGAHPDL